MHACNAYTHVRCFHQSKISKSEAVKAGANSRLSSPKWRMMQGNAVLK